MTSLFPTPVWKCSVQIDVHDELGKLVQIQNGKRPPSDLRRASQIIFEMWSELCSKAALLVGISSTECKSSGESNAKNCLRIPLKKSKIDRSAGRSQSHIRHRYYHDRNQFWPFTKFFHSIWHQKWVNFGYVYTDCTEPTCSIGYLTTEIQWTDHLWWHIAQNVL